MIEIENLCKSFDKHVIFKDFNLTVGDGEFVILSGESGKGKTTLLNIIGSLEPYDSGSVKINGRVIKGRKEQRRYLAETVGFLFQNFALIEDKTVRENLELISKKSRSGLTVEEALERVGMKDYQDKKIYTLSGGEQQRVAVARLFLKKCDLILADEPTGSLDKNNAEIIIQYLQKLSEEGKTVIVVTHDENIKNMGFRTVKI